MSVFLHVRGAEPSDANDIIDIDIKCFDEAWDAETWVKLGKTPLHAISVATNFRTPIGFGVFRYDEEVKSIEIIKLAVKNAFRRRGISMQLLMAGVEFGKARDAKELFIIIPESLIYPGPKNVSDWLKAVGFQAKNFVHNHFSAYGESEHGVRFTAPIRR